KKDIEKDDKKNDKLDFINLLNFIEIDINEKSDKILNLIESLKIFMKDQNKSIENINKLVNENNKICSEETCGSHYNKLFEEKAINYLNLYFYNILVNNDIDQKDAYE